MASRDDGKLSLLEVGDSNKESNIDKDGKMSTGDDGVENRAGKRGVGSIRQTLQLASYFFLWYMLTVIYNICNKRVLNSLPLPATVAFIQLLLGVPLFIPVWIVKRPQLTRQSIINYSQIALMHALGNLATVYSLGAGAVSFTHVVKAAEPLFSAVLSAFTGTIYPTSVYLSLVPIVVGVAIASCTEISFSWFGFCTAMLSNFFYQFRIVLAKFELKDAPGGDHNINPTPQISPAQLFRVITLLSAVELLPISILLEGYRLPSTWASAIDSGANVNDLLTNLVISGFSYYMYNEVAFWILGKINPVTHAVGNTVKRVVIILASVFILQSPMSVQGGIGSAVAIAGTLLYSLMMQRVAGPAAKKKKNAQA